MTTANAGASVFHWLYSVVANFGCQLQDLSGWQRYPVAFAFGALGAFGLAPYNFLPGIFISLTALVLLMDSCMRAKAPHRAAFLMGLAFGFGFFLAGMYWLAFAFLVQADDFAWMIPILVPGFMAMMALYVALPVWLASWRWQSGVPRVLLLAVLLALFEFLRGHLFTGLPWNLYGQSFAATALTAQSAAWVGPYGLSLFVILIGVLPGAMWRPGAIATLNWRPGAASAALLILLLTASAGRLWLEPVSKGINMTVAVMQPNVPQRDKMDPTKNDQHFTNLLVDTQAALPANGRSIAIWPENAYPFLSQNQGWPAEFAKIFPTDAVIFSGTYRTWSEDGVMRYGNSAALFGRTQDGAKPVSALYDKHHLVPFGEYLPLKGVLKALGLSQLAPTEDGFTPGPGPAVVTVADDFQFAPLICYEDVFPLALYPIGQRPDALVVITNDAWFGDNAGPKQHLHLARLRAIESGLPMIRSANTGISVVIDARGRILDEIPLYERGSLVRELPPAGRVTLYDRTGNLGFFLLILALCATLYQLGVARSG